MFKIKLQTNILKTMNRFAGKDESRFILCGVHVEVSRAGIVQFVATDGRRLAVLEIAEPAVDDFAFTIPSQFIDALPASEKAELVYGPETGEIQANFDHFAVHAAAIESRTGVVGKYPNWRHVVPKPWPQTFGNRNLAMNMPMLAEVCAAAHEFGDGSSGAVITSNGDVHDPICVKRGDFFAVVMPVKAADRDTQPPSFTL